MRLIPYHMNTYAERNILRKMNWIAVFQTEVTKDLHYRVERDRKFAILVFDLIEDFLRYTVQKNRKTEGSHVLDIMGVDKKFDPRTSNCVFGSRRKGR